MSVFSIFNHPGCYFMDSYYLFDVLLTADMKNNKENLRGNHASSDVSGAPLGAN